ncbi:MAG: peptide-methionine (S)-S-oxide reductase MsrA [Solirubrobacteraceae bacterium]
MAIFSRGRQPILDAQRALPGREQPMLGPTDHYVLHVPLQGPFPHGTERAIFALGCFWGAERLFWELPGVHVTAVGYSGGQTPNPTYEEVCSGRTGHAEAVLVVHDPRALPYQELLRRFWEGHDPTQGMRQGNDVGTQYRSAIYATSAAQRDAAEASRERYEQALAAAGHRPVTTEIATARDLYYAEEHHQQYLAKNPAGYCGLGGTGVACPVGPDGLAERIRNT